MPKLKDGIYRSSGRRGESTEYVEYGMADGNGIDYKQTVFVAQKGNGGAWFVFQVEPWRDGAIKTLDNFEIRVEACRHALNECRKFFKGE